MQFENKCFLKTKFQYTYLGLTLNTAAETKISTLPTPNLAT